MNPTQSTGRGRRRACMLTSPGIRRAVGTIGEATRLLTEGWPQVRKLAEELELRAGAWPSGGDGVRASGGGVSDPTLAAAVAGSKARDDAARFVRLAKRLLADVEELDGLRRVYAVDADAAAVRALGQAPEPCEVCWSAGVRCHDDVVFTDLSGSPKFVERHGGPLDRKMRLCRWARVWSVNAGRLPNQGEREAHVQGRRVRIPGSDEAA